METPVEIEKEIDYELRLMRHCSAFKPKNDNKYISSKLMNEYRERLQNPRLCYEDLSLDLKEEFNAEIKKIEEADPMSAKFKSMDMQKHFYDGDGYFGDRESRQYKALVMSYERAEIANKEKRKQARK